MLPAGKIDFSFLIKIVHFQEEELSFAVKGLYNFLHFSMEKFREQPDIDWARVMQSVVIALLYPLTGGSRLQIHRLLMTSVCWLLLSFLLFTLRASKRLQMAAAIWN